MGKKRKKSKGRKKIFRGKEGGRYVKTKSGKRYLGKGEKPPKKK